MATCFNPTGLSYVLCRIIGLLNYAIPVLIALGVVYFIWGVVMYMIANGEEAKTKGRDSIIYGLIGLAVIVSLWGLVYIIVNTFGLERDNYAPTPGELNRLLPQLP